MDPYKARKMAKVIAIVVAIAMVVTSFSFIFFLPSMFGMEGSVVYGANPNNDAYLKKQMDDLEDYIKYIEKYYKDEVTYEALMNGAFEGVVNALGDPYSTYYPDAKDSESFIDSVSGEFFGVGVSIENHNGQCRVVAPIANTPADRAGIRSGDIITKIDGIDIASKTLDQAAAMMRGKEGTKVVLTINRGGQTLTFDLIREAIKSVSVNYKMLENDIGYIQITSFDNDSDLEFKAARLTMVNKGAKGLVIDVRNNPGGLINTAVNIINQIVPKGAILHFEQKGKIIETLEVDGSATLSLPVVLLVNEGSASASEILAGALQDNERATLVGTTTYGKGVAQQISTLAGGENLKLSMYYFLTPNGTKIDHVGIQPDYVVDNNMNLDKTKLVAEYGKFAPMNEAVKPKAGDRGLNVYGAQQRLTLLGYKVEVNGLMDDKTVEAVRTFQKAQGFSPYGVLDYSTRDALEKATVAFVTGAGSGKDLQMEKAIELLKK